MIAPNSKKTPRRRHSNFSRVAIWGGLVVLVVAIMSFVVSVISDDVESPAQVKHHPKAKIPDVAPSLPVSIVQTPVTNVIKRNVRMERGVEVVAENVRTNQSGSVIEKLTLADGRVIEKVRPRKAIFNNPSDQVIAIALSYKPGQHMAPLPDLGTLDQDFVNSLLDPIRIEDDDPDDVKEQKLAVKEARAYIAAEIRNGRSVQECLQEHREQMESIADSHLMAIQEINNMRESGAEEEDVLAFRQRINEVFRERGIPELSGSASNQGEE